MKKRLNGVGKNHGFDIVQRPGVFLLVGYTEKRIAQKVIGRFASRKEAQEALDSIEEA